MMSYSHHANWPISHRAFYIEIYTILIQDSILNSTTNLFSLQSNNTPSFSNPLNAFNPMNMSSSAITIYHLTFPFIYLCIYPLPSRLSHLIPLEFSTPFIIYISNSYICDRTSDLYSQSQSQSQSLIFNLYALISQDLLQFSFRKFTFYPAFFLPPILSNIFTYTHLPI